MTARIFISKDAAAIAVGADQVAAAVAQAAHAAGRSVDIVRTGSRGLLWLEPLVEVEVAGERYGFGPIDPEDMAGLVSAGLLDGHLQTLQGHAKAVGPVES